MNNSSRKICFVAENVYPLLANTSVESIGGAELQQAIIGRCLQQAGHDVSFITKIFDNKRDDETLDGLRIYKSYDARDSVPIVRFFYPRLYRLWQALKRADAEIYYQRCASYTTAMCALFCRKYRRTFIYAGAHDEHFTHELSLNLRDRQLYKWGIRRADLILLQSRQQQALLKQNYGLDGQVLQNVYPRRPLTTAKGYALWVANLHEFKRPLLCLEVARRFPHIQFFMIGGKTHAAHKLYEQVRSHQLPNLTYLGFQPLEETERYFANASVLLNTSTMEGFPNTFLQAWSTGIPTLSFFDPDQIISRNDLGLAISNIAELDGSFDRLRCCDNVNRERIQRFFNDNFTPDSYVERLFQLLQTSGLTDRNPHRSDDERRAPRETSIVRSAIAGVETGQVEAKEI